MTHEDLIKEIKRLPLEGQKKLLEIISRDVWEHSSSREDRAAALERLKGFAKSPAPVIADNENGEKSLSQQLYGILQFEGGPPTDEEVKDMIADYLLKKYY